MRLIVDADIFFLQVTGILLTITGIGIKLRVRRLFKEVIVTLREELDYIQEASYISIFEANFLKVPHMRIPEFAKPIPPTISSPWILLKGFPSVK